MKKIGLLLTMLVTVFAMAQEPALMVEPQEMMDGSISLASVTLAEDGFVVVHAFDKEGELVLTPPLGLVYLEAGTHENVTVALDGALLEENGYGMDTKNVLPMIHVDANANQTYEFPEGEDVPVMVNDAMVVAELPIMVADTMMAMDMTPALSVSPQMAMGTTIRIDSVTLADDGFVVVHAYDTNGELVLTPPLGLVYLTAGTHENVMVSLDAALLDENGYGMDAKNVLPMVHIDANANKAYEFPEGEDVPVMVNEEMVVANLELTLGDMMMPGEGTFDVMLSGAQEVPAVMSEGGGVATVTLEGNSLTVSGDFMGLSSPYAASHVHMAAIGENGDVVFPLEATVAEDGMSGLFIATVDLNDEQLEAFMAGHFYINVHSEMHGGGELRAQLVPSMMQ